MRQKLALAAMVMGSIIFADIVTKRWALDALRHTFTVDSIAGIPLTLAGPTVRALSRSAVEPAP